MATSSSAILQHVRQLVSTRTFARLPDQDLLRRFAQEGDEAAYGVLLRRHGPMVWRVCHRFLPQVSDAEDVFQATFLVLARRAKSLRCHPSLAGWLHETSYRLARRARADVVRRSLHEAQVRSRPANDPLAEITGRELLCVLDEELERLPAKYRAPLVLCYLEGLLQDEAARQLGCSISTLKRRLEQGREVMRSRLVRRGVTLSTALLATALSESAGTAAAPPTIAAATLRAVLQLAAGNPVTGTVSANVAALVDAASKSLAAMKLKTAAILLAGLCVLGAGAGMVGHQSTPAQPRAAAHPPAVDSQAQPEAVERARIDTDGEQLPKHSLVRLGSLRHFRPGMRVDHAAFSPDGKMLALASRRAVTLWDLASGRELHQFQAPGFSVLMENDAVAFSPDGRLLAATSSTAMTVHVWDVSTRKELHAYRHGDWVRHLAFAPDGKTLATTASGDKENTIYLWDIATGRKLRQFKGHPMGWDKVITSIAFTPDAQTLASGSYDSAIRLWQVATGKETRQLKSPPIPGYRGVVGSVAFSMDGKLLVSAHGDGLIRVWDPPTGKKLRELKAHEDGVTSLAFSPDGKVLASGGGDHTIRLWDLPSGQSLRQIAGTDHKRGVFELAFSPDGATLVSWGGLHTVRFWDVATGKECRRVPGHQSDVAQIHFSADDKTLLSWGQDRTLRLWNLNTGQERCFPVGTNWGTEDQGVAFSPDGRLLALGSGEAVIDLWEVASGSLIRKLSGHGKYVTAVAFSPEGKTLASASSWDRSIRLWDPATGKQLRQWEGIRKDKDLEEEIRTLVYSPNGKVLASGGNDKTIRLWDVATGKEVRKFDGHATGAFPTQQPRPVCIAFSPNSKTVASARRNDSTIRLWEADSGKELRRLEWSLEPDSGQVFALAFSPTGRKLAVTRLDGTITIWEVATGRQVRAFRGHRGDVSCVAFSPNGQRLASGSSDSTILVWDVAGGATNGRDSGSELSAKQVEQLWLQLAAEDAAKADEALWRLVLAARHAVPVLKDQLRPVAAPDSDRIQRLLRELDSPSFAVREKASRDLENVGEAAAPALQKALSGKPSLEVRRRTESLLAALETPVGVRLQQLRAIDVLEYIRTPEAQKVLKSLSAGAPEARLTQEARASLDRLSRRNARK